MADAGILALDITDSSVGGILFAEGKQGTEVLEAHVCPISTEVPLEEALDEVVTGCSVRPARCLLSLGAEHFYYRSLYIPFTDPKKVRSVIPFEIEDSASFQDAPFLFDYILEPTDGKGTDVFAVLVEQETIERYLELLNKHNLDPELITVSGLPTVFNIGRYHKEPVSPYGLLQIGGRRATLIVVADKQIRAIRSLPYSQGFETDQSQAAQTEIPSEQDLHQLSAALQPLAADVRYALMAVQASLPGDSPVALTFDGPVGALPQVKEVMLKQLEGREWEGDWLRFARLKNYSSVIEQLPQGSLDNALALACCNPKDRERINFRKDEFSFSGKPRRFSKLLKVAVAASVLVFGCAAIYQGVDFNKKDRQRAMLSEQIEVLYRETIPGAAPGPDPVRELQVKVRDLNDTSGTGAVLDPSVNTVKLLADISAKIPASMKVSFERLIYDRKTISIKGLTDSFDNVNLMKSALAKSPYFSEVSIGSVNSTKEGQWVRFELKLNL